jgi:hypothetical protein
MPSRPLREVGVGGARRVLHSNEIRYSFSLIWHGVLSTFP